ATLSVSDASGREPALAPADASARIWRFDGQTPQLWVEDPRIDSSANEAVFNVRLSGAGAVPIEVAYATALPAGAAADPGRDFVATSGRLVFKPGQTLLQVRVPLHDGWAQVSEARGF